MADINDASGTAATGTNYSGLTSANYGITSPYVMQMLGRGQALSNMGYTPFRLPGGEGQADSARVANLNPMESAAYGALGGMNFQDPMNYGMGAVRGATESQWGAGAASPYMNAYQQATGGGNQLYNQATQGIGGLDFQRGMARGMGGTEAVLGGSFTGQGVDQYRQAQGTSQLLNQGMGAFGGMDAGRSMRQGLGNIGAAGSGQFGQQANQYLDPMRQQVGTSAGLNKATQAFGGIDTGDVMKQGMGMMTSAGTSQFGQQQANQYLKPMQQAVGTNAGLQAATSAFGQAGGAQGMQQGMQRLSQLGDTTFGAKEAQQYMSPYQQQVVDAQKQQAIQDYARTLPGQSAAAFQAGAGRGSRSALLQAEGQRNLQNQLGDIQAKGSQAAYENAQKQFGEDAARRMQAAQSQISSGTDITGRQAQLGTEDLARKQQQYETAARLYGEDTARKLQAGQSAVNAATDITGRQAQLGENELARRQQQYDTAARLYGEDKARQMQAGQAQLGAGTDIARQQAQLGENELARNVAGYTNAQQQYNTEMQNRLAASGQLFNQAGDIYNRQYQAGDTAQQRQIDAYNRSMDQYNADMQRRMQGGQNLFSMGSDIFGKQVAGGESQRAQKQKELDAMYEDFQKEIGQPKENVNYMMQLLGQVPQYSDYSTKSYQTAAPNDPNAAYANALGALGTYMGGGANGGSSATGWGGALEGIANALGGGSIVDKLKSMFGGG